MIIDESGNTNVIHYFPQSGNIQVFASLAPVDIFLLVFQTDQIRPNLS
jgi:hypothetical protein